MHKTKTISILASLALLAIVALVGALTYQSVSAQTPTQTPEPGTGDSADVPEIPNRAGRMQNIHGVTQEALAEALGIDVDTLTTAQETATQQALEQAISDGLITQEQADRLTERGFAGKFGFGMGNLGTSEIDYDALLANALNISVETLETARQEAFITTVDNAVAEGTITEEQGDLIKGQQALFNNEGFQSGMQSAFEAAVQQAVSDSVITQA